MSNYVKQPLSERDMQTKLDDIRRSVGGKMQKWADRLQFSMATKPKIDRIEGERWVEGGKSWVMHEGIKKTDATLQDVRMPWWCPKCTKIMNHRFDRKFYYLRGHCFNCNVDWEGEMRAAGKWEEFETRMLVANEKAFLHDKIEEHIDYMRTFKPPQLHFEDGRWEELAPISAFKEQFESLERDIEFMLARLDVIKQEEESANEPISEATPEDTES